MRNNLNSYVIQVYNNSNHLIPRRKYLHYLKDNRHISSCLFKYILYYLSKKSKFIYYSIKNNKKRINKNIKQIQNHISEDSFDLFNINLLLRSNKQIYIFIQEVYKKENIDQLGRLLSLLQYFISFPFLQLANQHFLTLHNNKQYI
jgi:hypothetical protein